jgi:hypothetical protein
MAVPLVSIVTKLEELESPYFARDTSPPIDTWITPAAITPAMPASSIIQQATRSHMSFTRLQRLLLLAVQYSSMASYLHTSTAPKLIHHYNHTYPSAPNFHLPTN